VSHSYILDRLQRRKITTDWLVCPLGNAGQAKPISQLPIEDLVAVREILFAPMKGNISDSKKKRTEKQYSIKSPTAFFWKCGVSQSYILDRLERGDITADWLVCPLGNALRAKPISQIPIEDLVAMREILFAPRKRNTELSKPVVLTPVQKPDVPELSISERLDALERLGKIKEQGILTEEEFAIEKDLILKAQTSVGPTSNPSTPNTKRPAAAGGHETNADNQLKKNNALAVMGFLLGIASVFLAGLIGIFPILAIVFSSLGLGTFNPGSQKNKWMAGVGLTLGIIYTVMLITFYSQY